MKQKIWAGNTRPDEWYDRGPADEGMGQEIHISKETGKPEIIDVEHPPIADIAKHNAEYAYSVLIKILEYSEAAIYQSPWMVRDTGQSRKALSAKESNFLE